MQTILALDVGSFLLLFRDLLKRGIIRMPIFELCLLLTCQFVKLFSSDLRLSFLLHYTVHLRVVLHKAVLCLLSLFIELLESRQRAGHLDRRRFDNTLLLDLFILEYFNEELIVANFRLTDLTERYRSELVHQVESMLEASIVLVVM